MQENANRQKRKRTQKNQTNLGAEEFNEWKTLSLNSFKNRLSQAENFMNLKQVLQNNPVRPKKKVILCDLHYECCRRDKKRNTNFM